MGDVDEAELNEPSAMAWSSTARAADDADLVRRFCVGRAKDVDPRGIRLRRRVMTGTLDLTGVDIPFPLRFDECEFEQRRSCTARGSRSSAITGCPVLPGLLANGIAVQGDLDLSRPSFVGAHATSASTSRKAAIWLCESDIGGRLLCVDTTIDPDGERAIQADRMRVGGTVRLLHNFHAKGELRLVGAPGQRIVRPDRRPRGVRRASPWTSATPPSPATCSSCLPGRPPPRDPRPDRHEQHAHRRPVADPRRRLCSSPPGTRAVTIIPRPLPAATR